MFDIIVLPPDNFLRSRTPALTSDSDQTGCVDHYWVQFQIEIVSGRQDIEAFPFLHADRVND